MSMEALDPKSEPNPTSGKSLKKRRRSVMYHSPLGSAVRTIKAQPLGVGVGDSKLPKKLLTPVRRARTFARSFASEPANDAYYGAAARQSELLGKKKQNGFERSLSEKYGLRPSITTTPKSKSRKTSKNVEWQSSKSVLKKKVDLPGENKKVIATHLEQNYDRENINAIQMVAWIVHIGLAVVAKCVLQSTTDSYMSQDEQWWYEPSILGIFVHLASIPMFFLVHRLGLDWFPKKDEWAFGLAAFNALLMWSGSSIVLLGLVTLCPLLMASCNLMQSHLTKRAVRLDRAACERARQLADQEQAYLESILPHDTDDIFFDAFESKDDLKRDALNKRRSANSKKSILVDQASLRFALGQRDGHDEMKKKGGKVQKLIKAKTRNIGKIFGAAA